MEVADRKNEFSRKISDLVEQKKSFDKRKFAMDLELSQIEEKIKNMLIEGDEVPEDEAIGAEELGDREKGVLSAKEEEARVVGERIEEIRERREELEQRRERALQRLESEEGKFKKSLRGFFDEKWGRILGDIEESERKMVLRQEGVLEELQGEFNRVLEGHLEREGEEKERALGKKKELALYEGGLNYFGII